MEWQSGLSELSIISWVSAIQGCPLSGVPLYTISIKTTLQFYWLRSGVVSPDPFSLHKRVGVWPQDQYPHYTFGLKTCSSFLQLVTFIDLGEHNLSSLKWLNNVTDSASATSLNKEANNFKTHFYILMSSFIATDYTNILLRIYCGTQVSGCCNEYILMAGLE